MRKVNPKTRQAIAAMEDELVTKAREIADELWKVLNEQQRKDGKVRQLRNILEVAESTDSWKALELFIRYQAARKEIPKAWAESAIQELNALQQEARDIVKNTKDSAEAVHLELVTRVLGHAVRWHLWDVKHGEG